MPDQVGCLPFFPVMPHNHSSPGQGGQLDETSWGSRLKTCYISLYAYDYLQQSNDALKTNTGTTNVLLKEITITSFLQYFSHAPVQDSIIRVKYDLATNNASYTAYANIYKNGTAIGTQQSTTNADPNFVTFSQDIDFGILQVGDKIQIYGHSNNASGIVEVQNFRLYFSCYYYFFAYINFRYDNYFWIKPYVWVISPPITFSNTVV
jgi:hypothetical protein